MPHTIYFISHPNVEINASVPVTQWPLSATGKHRMKQLLNQLWIQDLSAIYCSSEQKAIDGAQILSDHLATPLTLVRELGENDRTSTGFLEPSEFENTADAFFSYPDKSIRGWETATAAQKRIVDSISKIDREDATDGALAIVSHGAVGTLLYCHCEKQTINRRWDQPSNGGGNYMTVKLDPKPSCTIWKPIDVVVG